MILMYNFCSTCLLIMKFTNFQSNAWQLKVLAELVIMGARDNGTQKDNLILFVQQLIYDLSLGYLAILTWETALKISSNYTSGSTPFLGVKALWFPKTPADGW